MIKSDGILIFDKEDTDFDGIKFAIRATRKIDGKNYIKVQTVGIRSAVTGTDGHRLHKYKSFEDFPDGTYLVAANAAKEVVLVSTEALGLITFVPDDSAVLAIEEKVTDGDVHATITESFTKDDISGAFAKVIRALPPEECINIRYLEDLGDVFTANIRQGCGVMEFVSENRQAFIALLHM